MIDLHICFFLANYTRFIIIKRSDQSYQPSCTSLDLTLTLIYELNILNAGLFLVPYFTMLFLIGIPMYVLEMSLGQFTSQSLLQCWECAPALKGIGWGMLYMNTIVSIYYNVIIAWAIYYFAKSITSELPWERCREEFAGKCLQL